MKQELVSDVQHPAYMDRPVVYKIPVRPISSVYGPALWGSLVLADSHYLKMGALTLPPASNFAFSFWFIGMPYPSNEEKHVLLEMSTADGTSFVRFEQSGHNPTKVTTFLTIDSQPALNATSLSAFADSITSAAGARVIVGGWNHYLLSVRSGDKSAEICLNGQCLALQNSKQATDGHTYNVSGVGANALVLSSHVNGRVNSFCPHMLSSAYSCYTGQLDEIRVYRRALSAAEKDALSMTSSPMACQSRHIPEWQIPSYIPWTGEDLVLQHRIPNIEARYVFIKFPVCDQARSACNTQHKIPIVQAYVNRQQWHFATSSSWSWSGDDVPDISAQQP